MRPDKSNFDLGIGVLDGLGEADVTGEAGRAGEQHEELIVLRDLDGLFTREVVRWGVKEARSFEHTGRISQPHGIPIRLNFTRSGPPRPSASVEILKRRRIQKQRCQRHALSLKDSRLACQGDQARSEEHTSELQSPDHLVCRLLLEKKKNISTQPYCYTHPTQHPSPTSHLR